MFTGIIEELGITDSLVKRGAITALSVKAGKAYEGSKLGDSIAVNGVCLTVVRIEKGVLAFELLSETAKLTNLGKLKGGDKVNLERSLKVGERISGHFVAGHIDCLGIIRKKAQVAGNFCFEIAVPIKFMKYIAAKGSVCIDGISLTVVNKQSNRFSVYIIPHTLKNTTLNFKCPSSEVNVEFDILAKYKS